MGKRSTASRLAMQVLYQLDIQPTSNVEELVDHTMANDSFLEETRNFTIELVSGTWENKNEIDAVIKERSIGWSIERINNVDRSILRLSIYELKFSDTPPSVVINEAVNLAKKFGTEDSSKFINGILGGLADKKRVKAKD
ncbi:MAG: transcription antitermination factor NusB [Candidatus Margulisbacteria bacterium]|nr:transcription antitermination factor NusB [Candidatus Margulisiibacteriota bacterium]